MSARKPGTTTRTDDHPEPEVTPRGRRHAALVVAFPAPRALPLPISGEPVGRAWFSTQGAPDPQISTSHFVLTRSGGRITVEDASSRNGTWVNGTRIPRGERVPVSEGAVLRVGRTLLVLREDFVGSADPSPPRGALVSPFGLRRVYQQIDALAGGPKSAARENVLVVGETGTGKELVAREVAKVVGRDKKYTAVNVAAIGADVFESHLFGHAVGAFSGAVRASRGVFRAHEGGAVFLDEIGEVPLLLQPKLLRLLENREVMPVGESASPVDVLIVAATNRALENDVERSTFRRDLLARFGRTISMPSLRARAEDIHELARSVLERRGDAVTADTVEVEAVERLALAPWLSNIRELASVLNEVARIDARPGLRHEAVASVLRERGDARVVSAPTALTRSEAEAAVRDAGSERRAALDLGVSRGLLRRALNRKK